MQEKRESSWQRGLRDAEKFRHSGLLFWGIEVLGGALTAAAVPYFFMPDEPSRFEQAAFPAVGLVGGLLAAYLLFVLLPNLVLAPYRQRNEAWQALDRLTEFALPEEQTWKAMAAIQWTIKGHARSLAEIFSRTRAELARGVTEQGWAIQIAGWNSDNIYVQRINGFVYFQCSVVTTASRAAGTDVNICQLPTAFRPTSDFNTSAWMTNGQIGLVNVSASNGLMTVTSYPDIFPSGGRLVIGPLSWPYI